VEGRKIEDMKQFGLLYLYILKCHEKTPCIAILKKAKLSFFFFLPNQKTGGQNRFCLGVGTSGRREEMWKGCKRVNMKKILCTHYVNGK
jgi:hypothetical protein